VGPSLLIFQICLKVYGRLHLTQEAEKLAVLLFLFGFLSIARAEDYEALLFYIS